MKWVKGFSNKIAYEGNQKKPKIYLVFDKQGELIGIYKNLDKAIDIFNAYSGYKEEK